MLTDVVAAAASVDRKVKLRTMVKVSSDEDTEERGGYSGPQLFHRTVSLVEKSRRILDCPLHEQNASAANAAAT